MTTTDVPGVASASAADEGPPSWGWGRWLWRALTSMRTAVVLLTLLALAAVPGSLLPQRNVASDPSGVVEFARANPDWFPWLDRLGLFDVYASSWFAAVYLMLLVSMSGCVLPRCARLWRSMRDKPAPAPRNLLRLEHARHLESPPGIWTSTTVETAATTLRRLGYRVVVSDSEVRAETGYLREAGNLVFHLSLLLLLVGVGIGRLVGFEGRVVVVEGQGFANVRSAYDSFTPSVWTDMENLEPFSFVVDDVDLRFATGGARAGEPREVDASLTVATGSGSTTREATVRPNEPLVVGRTKAFLTGHGYAPVVTVRDGRGAVAFSGPAVFLPLDSDFTSEGVVKVPDAEPEQLGFEGVFLPTAALGRQGPYSAYPDTVSPRLLITAYAGDLGLDEGTPQSVFALDGSQLDPVLNRAGEPLVGALAIGDTMRLPGGRGSLTFDRVVRFANFQIAYDPGKEVALVAAVLVLAGLTTSLTFRRRRMWVRAGAGVADLAGLSLSRRPFPVSDLNALVSALCCVGMRDVHTPRRGEHDKRFVR